MTTAPDLVETARTARCPRRQRTIVETIYTTINFTRLLVTAEVGALHGRLICGLLCVVWEWSTHATVSTARRWLGVIVARKADLNWKL